MAKDPGRRHSQTTHAAKLRWNAARYHHQQQHEAYTLFKLVSAWLRKSRVSLITYVVGDRPWDLRPLNRVHTWATCCRATLPWCKGGFSSGENPFTDAADYGLLVLVMMMMNPGFEEATGLSGSDGKRPDGVTLIPWQRDVTRWQWRQRLLWLIHKGVGIFNGRDSRDGRVKKIRQMCDVVIREFSGSAESIGNSEPNQRIGCGISE